jgi:PAS domain S-box-containing protein
MNKKNYKNDTSMNIKIYLENIVERIPYFIFWKNKDSVYLGCNQKFANLVNRKSPQEVIGETDSTLGWGEEEPELFRRGDQEVMNGNPKVNEEEILIRPDGSRIIMLVNKVPLLDKHGNCIGILGTSSDITDRKKLEENLRISLKKAEAANEAKSEFIRNMSHDLRTPLAGIIGISSIQAQEGTGDQDRKHGQWVHGAGEELLELLNSVIDVTAAEHPDDSIKKDKIDLAQLVEELHALMLPAIESKKLQFELKLDANLSPIISDRSKLKRLLLNLLSNAVKFTKKGKVSLEICLLGIENNQAKIEMRIIDTGIGIAEDNLDKIFDRFYRTSSSYSAEYKGYGLGLYLVKKSLELLGGEIKVDSEEGKGSCFTLNFTFPLSKETVLIAEDNDLALYAVKNILIKLGYEVTAVTQGKAALDALKNQSFSWVLLDIGLPDLNGTEVTRLYRQWEQENNKPHLPIFALTAHAEDEAIEKYKEMGIDYVLHKPFTEKDINTIKKFIKK